MHAWNLWGSVPPTKLRTTGLVLQNRGGSCVIVPYTESISETFQNEPILTRGGDPLKGKHVHDPTWSVPKNLQYSTTSSEK